MRPIRKTLSLSVADPDGAAASQIINTTATLDGVLVVDGVAIFETARHVLITGTASTVSVNFTITGTDRYGNAISEVIVGPAAATTAEGLLNFKTITSIVTDGDTVGAVLVGEADAAEGPWIPLDHYQTPFEVHMYGELVDSGAMTFGVEHTADNVQAIGFQENDATAYDDATFLGKSADFQSLLTTVVRAVRMKVSAHTAGGVQLTLIQAGF